MEAELAEEYVSPWPELCQTIGAHLLQFGVFRERGKKTLTADLDDETLPKLEEVYNFILDRMDDIVPRY